MTFWRMSHKLLQLMHVLNCLGTRRLREDQVMWMVRYDVSIHSPTCGASKGSLARFNGCLFWTLVSTLKEGPGTDLLSEILAGWRPPEFTAFTRRSMRALPSWKNVLKWKAAYNIYILDYTFIPVSYYWTTIRDRTPGKCLIYSGWLTLRFL